MARYSGDVEAARRDLRELGFSAAEARTRAPHLAGLRQQTKDRSVRPYPWLGCQSDDARNGSDHHD